MGRRGGSGGRFREGELWYFGSGEVLMLVFIVSLSSDHGRNDSDGSNFDGNDKRIKRISLLSSWSD